MPFLSYHVAPRYTAGSPASFSNDEVAKQVMEEELSAYARVMTGRYGADDQQSARRLGLSGIVTVSQVFANYRIVTDMITGDVTDTRTTNKVESYRVSPNSIVDEVGQLTHAAEIVAGKYETLLKDLGGCDHSTGICQCGDNYDLQRLQIAVGTMKRRLQNWMGSR